MTEPSAVSLCDPFAVTACEPNGHAVHPPRPICPRCGATRWRPVTADTGVLEELTARRAIDQARRLPAGESIDRSEALLGRVRLDTGPVVICRLLVVARRAPPRPGARVRLRTRTLEAGSRVVQAVPDQ